MNDEYVKVNTTHSKQSLLDKEPHSKNYNSYSETTDKFPKSNSDEKSSPHNYSGPKKFSFKVFLRIFKYSFRYRFLLFISNISLIITALTQSSIPYICGLIMDAINKNQAEMLSRYCIYFFIISLISGLFGFIRGFAFNLLGSKVVRDLRGELYESLINKDIALFDKIKSGEFVSRIGSDISVIENTSSENISMIIRNLIQFTVSFVILFTISWSLTLYVLLVVPPIIITIIIFAKYYRKYSKEYQDSIAESSALASEVFINIRVVKSFSTEKREVKKFNEKINTSYNLGYKKSLMQGVFIFIITICSFLAILFVLWIGGRQVLDGTITSGQLSSYILYTITLSTAIGAMIATITQLINTSAISEKIFELIDLPTKIHKKEEYDNKSSEDSARFKGNIELRDVCFSYPSKSDVEILSKVNFHIRSGEKIAIVGSSGSGKSTIVSLIERFYDVDSGSVLIDESDIRQLNLENLHKLIGFVPQEPTLFSGSIKENVVYGVDSYTSENIEEAITLANANEFITDSARFPLGLESIVGERGIQLSGGQKQRIAIARALIKKPKILIFDEATSALDSESEYLVQRAIDSLITKGDSTIIIIAHRLSTIVNCDRIIVIKNGVIVEQGNHGTLLNLNGFYKNLIERQIASVPPL